MRVGGPQGRSEYFKDEENSLVSGFEPRMVERVAKLLHLLRYSGFVTRT
jgi:hypothetical protein